MDPRRQIDDCSKTSKVMACVLHTAGEPVEISAPPPTGYSWRHFLGKAAESTKYCDLCVIFLNIEY